MTLMMIADAHAGALDPAPPVCCQRATGYGNKQATTPLDSPVSSQMLCNTKANGSFRGISHADISNLSCRLGYVVDLMATFGAILRGLAREWRARR